MLSYEEALEIVSDATKQGRAETVGLGDCLGRVLAQEIRSPIDLPPFDNSAVDGYALGSLAAGEFSIIGQLPAGSPAKLSVSEGEACRVFTGSRLPDGTLTVVMQETVTVRNGTLHLQESPAPGSHMRKFGEELRSGDLLLPAGTRVTPPVLGLLATIGLAQVDCFRRPRVSIVGTGSELVPPGQPLGLGQVYESNTYGVQAAVRSLGIDDVAINRVPDDLALTKDALAKALDSAEVLIVCGGMSVGDHDFARPALEALGVRQLIWQVKIKPGKPFYFGLAPGGQRVFGLPGNPVSALVVFLLFVRPSLLKMMGRPSSRTRQNLRAGEVIQGSRGRDEFARATVRDQSVTLVDRQGSHMLSGLAHADALVRIPADAVIEPGDPIEAIPLDW
jgi:molybdopterin molybdotransferase